MAGSDGETKITIKGESKDFESAVDKTKDGLDEVQRKTRETSTQTEALTASFRKMTAALISIGAVKSVVVDSFRSIVNEGDRLAHLSKTFNINAVELQKLGYAAQQNNATLDQLSTALGFLSKNAFDAASGNKQAASAFRMLGVNVKDVDGGLKDTNALFLEVADALGSMSNETEQAAIAKQVMGRAAMELLPLLEEGSSGIRALGDEALRTGGIMSKDLVAATDELNDNLNYIKLVGKGLAVDVFGPMIENLAALSRWFRESADAVGVLTGAFRLLQTESRIVTAVGTMGLSEIIPFITGRIGEGQKQADFESGMDNLLGLALESMPAGGTKKLTQTGGGGAKEAADDFADLNDELEILDQMIKNAEESYNEMWRAQIAGHQAQIAAASDTIGAVERQISAIEELRFISADDAERRKMEYQQAIFDIQNLALEAQASAAETQAAISRLNNDYLNEQLGAWARYADAGLATKEMLMQAFSALASTIGSMVADGLVDGFVDAKEAGKAFLKMLIQMVVQLAIMVALVKSIKFAIAGPAGLVLHDGGLVTTGRIPKKHSGMGVAPDERFAVLQTGEFVVQRRAMQKPGALAAAHALNQGQAPISGGGQIIQTNNYSFTIPAMDGASVERVVRDQIEPMLIRDNQRRAFVLKS